MNASIDLNGLDSYDPLAGAGRLVVPFAADDGDGHWITIGAHGEGGDRHGGTPVFVKDGRITKGAPSLTGKRIDALKEDATDLGSHRAQLKAGREYARAVWGKEARKIGHKPEHLHQLAAEMMAHDKATVEDRTKALQSARKTIESYGGDWRGVSFRAAKGGDAAKTRGIDVAAETLARQYPHLFPDPEHEHASDRLFDMLAAGNPKPMAEDDAYKQALDELSRYLGSPPKEREYRGRKAKGDAYEGGETTLAGAVEDAPFTSCGRWAGFGAADQPRVAAGSSQGGEWTSGRGGAAPQADPFSAFRKAPSGAQPLFAPASADVRPGAGREKTLRELSAVQKRDLRAWDLPQPVGLNHASIRHLPTGQRIESTMGDEYDVKGPAGDRRGHFRTAAEAADFVEKQKPTATAAAPLAQTKPASSKLFDFSAADYLAGCGRLVEFYSPDQQRDNYGRWVGPDDASGPAPARPRSGQGQPPRPGRQPRNFQEFRRLLSARVRALANYIGQTVACTPAFYATVAHALNTVDDDYHEFLSREGRTILLGDNLAVMDPALKGQQPQGWSPGSTWAEVPGAYDPVRRRVMLPEWVADKTGAFHAHARIVATAREEIGHALDHALDQRTPQRAASSSDPQFLAAYRTDESAITDPAVRVRLGYFLQSGAAGRAELFAQLFVIMGGAGLVPAALEADLRKAFPNCLRVLPTILP